MKKLLLCLGLTALATTLGGCEIYFGQHGHHDHDATHYCEGTGEDRKSTRLNSSHG